MLDNLKSLQNLTKIDVVLAGDWTFPSSSNRTWQGEAIAETSIVSIIFLSCNGLIYWAKSSLSAANALEIRLVLHPTTGRNIQFICSVGHSGGDIHNASATLNSKDYLPEIAPLVPVQTGTLVTMARFDSIPAAELYALFLCKHDVKVARKHIWGLRKALLTGLPSLLVEVFTHGRKGELPI